MKRGLIVAVLAACAAPTPQPAAPAAPPPFIREHARAFGHYAAYRGPTHAGHRRMSRYVSDARTACAWPWT